MFVFRAAGLRWSIFPSCLSGAAPALVWILGHSYVFWGAKRAEARPEGRQLGFPREEARIHRLGVPGMLWSRMDRPPDVLILHVGGNDLGLRSMLDLTKDTNSISFAFAWLSRTW